MKFSYQFHLVLIQISRMFEVVELGEECGSRISYVCLVTFDYASDKFEQPFSLIVHLHYHLSFQKENIHIHELSYFFSRCSTLVICKEVLKNIVVLYYYNIVYFWTNLFHHNSQVEIIGLVRHHYLDLHHHLVNSY